MKKKYLCRENDFGNKHFCTVFYVWKSSLPGLLLIEKNLSASTRLQFVCLGKGRATSTLHLASGYRDIKITPKSKALTKPLHWNSLYITLK